MAFLFGFLFFVALMMLLTGLVKPELVIKWGEKKDKKEVLKYYGTATLVLLILTSCFETSLPTASESSKYPYHFVKSDVETVGPWTNTKDLYYCSDPIDVNLLKEFCKYKKATTRSEAFYFVVIFDNEKNTVSSKSKFNGGYADEPEVAKHIRAFYVYNAMNGFSELNYYEKNSWESMPQTFKL